MYCFHKKRLNDSFKYFYILLVNYRACHFVIFLSYLLSFFKTLKLFQKNIIGSTICSVNFILANKYKLLHTKNSMFYDKQ